MPLIEITQLKKSFDIDEVSTFALRGVDLTVEKGEFLAIVGPSGSGKSTLLQIIGLLDPQTSGTYLLNGSDTSLFSDEDIAELRNKQMGFIFQSFNLLARTSVLENVKLPFAYSKTPPRTWDEHAKKQIESVGLTHRTQHEPNQLSGGERQRVAIARALVNDPEVIFADEPTGNLDSVSGKAVMDILERLHSEGKTIILITHDRQLAKKAHRAILMRDGLIAWEGDAKNIPELE
jgi:putative ABC transport system ATP-binding protein